MRKGNIREQGGTQGGVEDGYCWQKAGYPQTIELGNF